MTFIESVQARRDDDARLLADTFGITFEDAMLALESEEFIFIDAVIDITATGQED